MLGAATAQPNFAPMTEEEKQTATIIEAGDALESQISQLQTVNKEREGQVH